MFQVARCGCYGRSHPTLLSLSIRIQQALGATRARTRTYSNTCIDSTLTIRKRAKRSFVLCAR